MLLEFKLIFLSWLHNDELSTLRIEITSWSVNIEIHYIPMKLFDFTSNSKLVLWKNY